MHTVTTIESTNVDRYGRPLQMSDGRVVSGYILVAKIVMTDEEMEAAGQAMQCGADGVYECPHCHYRYDSPRAHNCGAILRQREERRNPGGWSHR